MQSLCEYELELKQKNNIITKFKLEQLPEDPTYIAHEEDYVKMWDVNADNDMTLYNKMIHKNRFCPVFDFMDGPPFVSGNLHPGHIAVASFKSALFNFKIMDGYLCTVKPGYDCHGLPALNKTAQENNLTIEQFKAMPIAESNALCEKMVFKYKNAWTPLIKRIGRFVDFENDYMTRNPEFMESCWWIFKHIYEQGNVYKGEKVMPYSYGNQTPLSNFEASQNYSEKETKSVYVGFEMIVSSNSNACIFDSLLAPKSTSNKTYFVVWTTTSWTLPFNLALCVNPNSSYVRFRVHSNKIGIKIDNNIDNNIYIMGKNSVANLFNLDKIEILNEVKGSDLVGMTYIPIYPFTQDIDKSIGLNREYKIVSDLYVKDEKIGSGIVHLAPAFGDDDFRVCSANGLITNTNVSYYCPIDDYGRFTDVIDTYKGRLVFDCEDDIRNELKKRYILFKTQQYKHNYPYCWRTNTPLIYRATPSYYIRATAYRNRMLELNATVSWTPKEIGENRFHQWLSDIKDWSVSRSTSYATPIPIWKAEDGSELCIGSIDELEALSGIRVNNLHPEYVNDIIIEKDGKSYRRIPDTFDCWFESGAVPMAQLHYPFNEKSKTLETREFLSDFICEGMDQTRGWFYTLMVLSTAILDCAPYRNVMCTGMILDKNGEKLSKKLNNFIDPHDTIIKYGADIMRVYFINSPLMSADCLKFNEETIRRLKYRFTPYINGVKFWIEHTLNFMKQHSLNELNLSSSTFENKNRKIVNLFDKWIMLRINELTANVRSLIEKYCYGGAIEKLLEFIEHLTNWYIKFNRDRIKGLDTEQDWSDSIYVLYNVLMIYCRLWAPFTPFLSELIYQHLRFCSSDSIKIDSVLLTDYPRTDCPRTEHPKISNDYVQNEIPKIQDVDTFYEDNTLISKNQDISSIPKNQDISPFNGDNAKILALFKDLQRVCFLVRVLRDASPIHKKMVIPLKTCTIYHDSSEYLELLKKYIHLVQAELNCRQFVFELLKSNITIGVNVDRKAVGQAFRKDAVAVTKLIESQSVEELLDLYDEKTQLVFKSASGNELVIDKKYYKLTKIPRNTITNEDISCQIDADLMVSIDHTYDEEIHNLYQCKRLHMMIQDMRKQMGLRPWNNVNVILDEVYATSQMKLTLQANLTNATVFIALFTDDSIYNTHIGVLEIDRQKVCVNEFVLESFDVLTSNITGRLVLNHKIGSS